MAWVPGGVSAPLRRLRWCVSLASDSGNGADPTRVPAAGVADDTTGADGTADPDRADSPATRRADGQLTASDRCACSQDHIMGRVVAAGDWVLTRAER